MVNYWLKMIRNDDVETLLNEKVSGMSWSSIKRVRNDPMNPFVGSSAFGEIKEGDKVLLKVVREDEKPTELADNIYDAIISKIDWASTEGKSIEDLEGPIWVHFFHFSEIKPIGKRSRWKGNVEFLNNVKDTQIGRAFQVGMWNISKEDYEKIIKGW